MAMMTHRLGMTHAEGVVPVRPQFNIVDYQEKLYADILARRKEQRRQAKKAQEASRNGRINASSRTASTAAAGTGREPSSHQSRSAQR